MTVTLAPDIAHAFAERAHGQGTTPETLILEVLRQQATAFATERGTKCDAPADEWETLLQSVGVATGVSLSDEAVRRENLYE